MTQRFVTILAILITASMMLGAEANACSNCPGDPRGGGTKNTGNAQSDPDHDRATNRSHVVTTYPDTKDLSVKEKTKIKSGSITQSDRPKERGDSPMGNAATKAAAGPSGINGHMNDKNKW